MAEDLDSVKSSTVDDVVVATDCSEDVESDNANIPSSTVQDSKPEFSADEETLIIRMYNLVGERWSLIAGRIPGRSAEEIEKYWNSRNSSSTTNP